MVNVFNLKRECEESVCKVWVSVEPEYKHAGGSDVCTPFNADE